jgi:hypothetical protein
MHVDLLWDEDNAFPTGSLPAKVTSLKVWYCKYQTLEALRTFIDLRTLAIASFPDDSFEAIGALKQLESLQVLHFPRVSSLEPLRGLSKLRSLSLESLPSWDSSSKRLVVDSLAPLADLPNLEVLRLLGVVPQNQSLAPLEKSKSLRVARFHGYAASEKERFFQSSGVESERGEA